MKISWTERASANALAIHTYIADQSEAHADSVYARILERSQQLIEFPNSGAIVPEFDRQDVRELFVLSFRLIYQVLPNEVRVLAVIHGAQRLGRFPSLEN
jgi:plasmid stabilization system protein ParE